MRSSPAASPGATESGRKRRSLPASRAAAVGVAFFLLCVFGAVRLMHGWVALGDRAQPVPGAASSPEAARPPEGRRSQDGALPAAPLLAGSGAGLPALEMLAREYAAASGKSVRLGPSLGTSGGVRALADGAVDAAIASRKLAPAEAQGLEQVEFAVGELVLAAGRDVPDASIRVEDLRRLLAGDSVTWSDGGAAEFLLREPGDSGTQAFLRAYPDLAPAFEDAAETARWPVLVTDRSMEATLVSQGRAVGVFERQAIRVRALPLEVLHIVDAVPAEAASRPLTLLLRADASADVRQFAAFVCGPAAQALLARAGYAAGSCAGGGKP